MQEFFVGIVGKLGVFAGTAAGKLLLTQAGAGIIIGLIVRYMPDDKYDALLLNMGRIHSALMRSKLGKFFWEPVETFAEKRIKRGVEMYFQGANEDDDKPQEPAPPAEPPK
jgi:hypothetical protein